MDEEVTLPRIVKRRKTSIYVDPLVWQGFRAKCSRTGQSTCHVLEAFMYAFNKALPDQPVTSLPQVNVNLTVNRVVKRPRRVSEAGLRFPRIDWEGSPERCFFCDEESSMLVSFKESRDLIRRVYCCDRHFLELRDTYRKVWWTDLKKDVWRPWKEVKTDG